MSRIIKTATYTTGGEGRTKFSSTSFESFKMNNVGKVLNRARNADIAAGRPKRKLSPISTYLFEHLIQEYFTKYATKDVILEQITIKDTHEI